MENFRFFKDKVRLTEAGEAVSAPCASMALVAILLLMRGL